MEMECAQIEGVIASLRKNALLREHPRLPSVKGAVTK